MISTVSTPLFPSAEALLNAAAGTEASHLNTSTSQSQVCSLYLFSYIWRINCIVFKSLIVYVNCHVIFCLFQGKDSLSTEVMIIHETLTKHEKGSTSPFRGVCGPHQIRSRSPPRRRSRSPPRRRSRSPLRRRSRSPPRRQSQSPLLNNLNSNRRNSPNGRRSGTSYGRTSQLPDDQSDSRSHVHNRRTRSKSPIHQRHRSRSPRYRRIRNPDSWKRCSKSPISSNSTSTALGRDKSHSLTRDKTRSQSPVERPPVSGAILAAIGSMPNSHLFDVLLYCGNKPLTTQFIMGIFKVFNGTGEPLFLTNIGENKCIRVVSYLKYVCTTILFSDHLLI